jgi:hypothetical protein
MKSLVNKKSKDAEKKKCILSRKLKYLI